MVAIRCSVDASAGRCASAWLNPCRHSPVRVFSSTCFTFLPASLVCTDRATAGEARGSGARCAPATTARWFGDHRPSCARHAPWSAGAAIARQPGSHCSSPRLPDAVGGPGAGPAARMRRPRPPMAAARLPPVPPRAPRLRPGGCTLVRCGGQPAGAVPGASGNRGSRWPPPASRRFRRGLPDCPPGATPLSVAAVSPPVPPAVPGGGTVFHHGGCGLGRLRRTDRATWRRRAANPPVPAL